MNNIEFNDLLAILNNVQNNWENEWIERKENFVDKEKIAETISAISNSACIKKKTYWYIIRWVNNEKREVVWTSLNIYEKKIPWKKNWSNLWQWLNYIFKSQIQLEILETTFKSKRVFALKIQASQSWKPTIYNNIPYVRIYADKSTYNDNWNNHPNLLKQIYNSNLDITWQLTNLKINDLDDDAITKFKKILFSNKNNQKYEKYTNEEIFRRLNILIDWYITYWWAILLAKEEFGYKLFCDKWQITWKYEDRKNHILERKIWKIPLILSFDEIENEIQRFNTVIQETTLFRKDLKQYESKAIREILFNSIVHRDWTINKRIEIYQTPQSIKFTNPWLFIAKLDDVLKFNKRPDYRNPNLSNTFKSLNLIEKEWWWLRDVYYLQLIKWLTIVPNFETDSTCFELIWYIKDINFAKSITQYENIDSYNLVLLDRISNGLNKVWVDISIEDANKLKEIWYIEISWRKYKRLNLWLDFSKKIKKTWVRTRIQWLNREWYEDHIIKHIKEYWKIYFYEVVDICKWKDKNFCFNLLRKLRNKNRIKLIKINWLKRNNWYHIIV